MTRTALKDIIREIKTNKGRFFSIFALLFISMVAFSGLFHAAKLFEITGEYHYEETNLQDITITSTLGMADRDEFIISQNPHVEAFEMGKSVDVFINDSSEIIRLESIPEKMALLVVKEGRLPEKNDEIVLSYDYFLDKINIGDEITFMDSDSSTDINDLKESTFTVVGFVRTTDYLTAELTEISTIGSGTLSSFGFVKEDVFDTNYYTKARIRGKGLNKINSFDDEYTEKVEILRKELEEDFEDRPASRLEEVKEDAYEEIKDAEQEIKDARAEIADARAELEDAKDELNDAEIELREAELDIREGEVDLKEARVELDDGWLKYYDGFDELDEAEREARAEIADGKKELADAKIELEDGRRKLADGEKEYAEGKEKLEDAKKEFADGEKAYNENLQTYLDGKKELDDMKEKIRISREIALGELNEQKSKENLESTITKLESEVKTHNTNLENYKAQLNYNKGLISDNENNVEIEKKINDLENLIAQEEENLNKKSNKLKETKEALESFEEVQNEGRLSDQVIEYSGEAIEEGEKELADGKKQLDEAKETLDEARKEIQDGVDELEEARIELEDARAELADGEREYRDGLQEIKDAEKTLEEELADGYKELADAKVELEDGEIDYKQGLEDLEQGKKDYKEGLEEYYEGLSDYEEGKIEFDEESKDAMEEIEEGEADIEKAKKDILKLKEPTFMVETRHGDTMYDTVNNNPRSLRILAFVFSVLALLIALLVASTTMTRMVDERRVLIGTYKGLGYENKVIASKFVIFGGVSGMIGMVLGTLAGQYILAPVIYRIYMEGTVLIDPLNIFSENLFIIGIFLTLLTTTLSAYLSVNKSLKENTASLLRPKAPKAGSRILLERISFIWDRLGFMNKITARNLFRYKGRMFMTIIGVQVTMALMILGFGMKDSIEAISEIQFTELQQEDLMLSINEGLDKSELEETLNNIENHENIKETAKTNMRRLKLQIPGESTQDVNLYIRMDENLDDMFNFRDRKTNESIPLKEEGILVSEKLANLVGVEPGDTMTIPVENEEEELLVTGIIEMYLGHGIYMDESYFRDNFDLDLDINMVLVEFHDDSKEAREKTSEELLEDDNILTTISTQLAEDAMNDTIDSINIVIIIIVFIAMLLSLTVLYNLTNINVSERIRELSTMKVLGFYPRELTEYVYKETFILSFIGIILGIFLGKAIVIFVLKEFAPMNMMFGDPNYLKTYTISIILTIVFTLIVMVIMHKKLKDIDMVEALKSVD